MFNWSEFKNILNIDVNEVQKKQLNHFYEILKHENEKYNLTRIIELDDVLYKHFIDSIIFINDFDISNQRIIDIGSGAGFPGVVIKILFPSTWITLVDSNNKKVHFLNKAINELNLQNIIAINARAEELSRMESENYDIVVSRAVAYTDVMLEISVRFLKIKGHTILLKGPNAINETSKLESLLKKIKMTKKFFLHYSNSNVGERNVLIFEKTGSTPELYPRDYSKIVKNSSKNKI